MPKENEQEKKLLLRNTFDSIANGYDIKALRFFRKAASHLGDYLHLKGNEHVLDVATGTGNAAFALCDSLPNGRITGVDFSVEMLARAQEKRASLGNCNISFLQMDMQSLDFPDGLFDAAVSSFGLFFVQDMLHQLRHIIDKVRPGGRVLATSFHETTFNPLNTIFFEHLRKYEVIVPPESLKRLSTEQECVSLFENAGMNDVSVDIKRIGYYLDNAAQWWDIVWNAGFRRFVSSIAPEKVEQFKEEHLREIGTLMTEDGLWLEVNILYTSGIKKP